VDFSKIKRVLPGFQPEWNVRRGAQEIYAACREAELTLEDFEGPRFKRITHIRKMLAAGRLDTWLRWTTAEQVTVPSASAI